MSWIVYQTPIILRSFAGRAAQEYNRERLSARPL